MKVASANKSFASVAFTVYEASGRLGTVNDVEKLPSAAVVVVATPEPLRISR